jgi:hypothetical protein
MKNDEVIKPKSGSLRIQSHRDEGDERDAQTKEKTTKGTKNHERGRESCHKRHWKHRWTG